MAGGGASPAQLSFPEGEAEEVARGREGGRRRRAPRRSRAGPVASQSSCEPPGRRSHPKEPTPPPRDSATAVENSRPKGRGLGAGPGGGGASSREQRPLQDGWGFTTGWSRCWGSTGNSDPCRVTEDSPLGGVAPEALPTASDPGGSLSDKPESEHQWWWLILTRAAAHLTVILSQGL